MSDTKSEIADGVGLELRRGAIVLAVLSRLRQEQYGYSLRNVLAEHGMKIDEGTLYPLLRRLEGQGLLDSSWRIEEGRPRRYYLLNSTGETVLGELRRDWSQLVRVMEDLLA